MKRLCRLLHGQPSQLFELNYILLLTGRIVLSNKKRNLKKYSVVFFLKQFPKKKKLFGGSCILHDSDLLFSLRTIQLASHYRSLHYACSAKYRLTLYRRVLVEPLLLPSSFAFYGQKFTHNLNFRGGYTYFTYLSGLDYYNYRGLQSSCELK